MTERIAIIDLGSNSARLIIMHIYTNGAYNLVYHQKETVRLSEGMTTTKLLNPETIKRAIGTLKIFSHMCRLFQVNDILAVATAAVRDAKNGDEFLREVTEETGIALKVISGKDEAFLGYTGVINTLDITDAVLFDLGGGSTELTLIKNRQPESVISLPFGAVNLTERFGTQNQISAKKLYDLSTYIIHHLAKVPWLADSNLPLVGVGGTARNIAKMDQKRKNYPFNKVHNYRLGSISFNDLWQALLASDLKQRAKFAGLSRERSDIIVAGTTIIKCLFDTTNSNRLIISGCGVREGIFLKHYLTKLGQPIIIDDILEHSTKNMLLFYKANANHAYHVAALADAMFEGWQELHNMDHRDRLLLRITSLLHDIGITINFYDHTRHSAYLVENARLFGLTHREQMLAAVIVGWHNGPQAKYTRNKFYSEFLDDSDWQKARKLSLLLALAERLEATQMQLIQNLYSSIENNVAYLNITVDAQAASIELEEVQQHRKWFKKEFGVELKIKPCK
ncbi:MAG: ppx 2 [Firmicutes bacterium]|nr:ppx 2 [Bacillota bacterium]